jgi:hypothetical protein
VALLLIAYFLWCPGQRITDGRHDRGHHAVWLSHGWLGAESWFVDYDRSPDAFHDPAQTRRKKTQRQPAATAPPDQRIAPHV